MCHSKLTVFATADTGSQTNYTGNQMCLWHLRAPDGFRIRLSFSRFRLYSDDFQLVRSSSNTDWKDWVDLWNSWNSDNANNNDTTLSFNDLRNGNGNLLYERIPMVRSNRALTTPLIGDAERREYCSAWTIPACTSPDHTRLSIDYRTPLPTDTFTSSSNLVTALFVSDWLNEAQGFTLNYEVIDL